MSVKFTERAKLRRKQGWIQATGKRLALLFVLGSATIQFTGCTAFTALNNKWQYNGYWNTTIMGQRIRSGASKAWHSRKHHFCNEKHLKEFSAGFKAGYADVADGGAGCSPAFPPREYWGWKYQSCEGQARVAAWFSGFPHGARAAEEEGVGNWTQLQTSTNIQHEYAANGKLNQSAAGMYPIAQSAIPNGMPTRESNDRQPIDFGRTYPISVSDEQVEATNMPSIYQQ